MSSRSRRVKPEAWKAGDVVWVQYKAGPARGTLDKRLGETTWNVSFDDGEETQIIECLLLREQPTEEESGGDDDALVIVTPVRKKQKRSGGSRPTSADDCVCDGGFYDSVVGAGVLCEVCPTGTDCTRKIAAHHWLISQTEKEIRVGKLALITPVMTSTDGRCVAMIR